MFHRHSLRIGALLLAVGLTACGTDDASSAGDGYGQPSASTPVATTSAATPSGSGSDGYSTAPQSTSNSSAPSADAPTVQLSDSPLGEILTDAEGFTLYLFTKDGDGGVPTCEGGCAAAWPAAIADTEAAAGDGIDPSLVTTVDTPNGPQLKIGKWPLYRYASDAAPGDTGGQGSGGVWFVVGADGKPIK